MIHQSASVLQTSLDTLRQINWHDDIHQVPNDIDQSSKRGIDFRDVVVVVLSSGEV